jgi:competence protein ComEC
MSTFLIDKNKEYIFKTQKKIAMYLAVCFIVLAIYLIKVFPNSDLEITFFDIGQGDSIFIKTPENHQILIDTGPDSMVLKRLSENMPFFDRTIDMIVLTHPDLDHIGGIVEILKRYEVKYLLVSGVAGSSPLYRKFIEIISSKIDTGETQLINAEYANRIFFGEVYFDVLFPFSSVLAEKVSDVNDYSVALQLNYAGKKALFCGDISSEIEANLISVYGSALTSDIFKVNHHGSKYSNSLNFLQMVSPEIAVISVGKDNQFGHPNIETLLNLNKANVSEIRRTDVDGTVKLKISKD